MNYYEVFKARTHQGSNNPAERLEKNRQKNFERFLKQSPHYVAFEFEGQAYEAVLEPSSQDETKTVMHLLCKVGVEFQSGQILEIDGAHYLVWYWDERRNSGYNRYALLKLSQTIEWLNDDDTTWSSEAYIYGPNNTAIYNERQSRSRSDTLYMENKKYDYLIMPLHEKMLVGSYLSIQVKNIKKHEVVAGIDILSTKGIMYVTLNPTYEHDLSAPPEKTENDTPDDYYWLGELQ